MSHIASSLKQSTGSKLGQPPNSVSPHRVVMEGQEGTQELHLILAHKLFLLRHPDVQDIEKVQLKDEVFAVVKADGNYPLSPIIIEFPRLVPHIPSRKMV